MEPVVSHDHLASIQANLKAGKYSCYDLVLSYLARIDDSPVSGAFLEVYRDEALAAATTIDQSLTSGTEGKLAGLVVGLKDVICYKGHEVSASSLMLKGFTSHITASAVDRLLAEGAIILGRLSCDEFAMGSSNETSYDGPVPHPTHPQYVPGGSSGGSAAAVAANLVHASLGSDTGGSVRQPAAFCGVVGLKPTYGRVPRYGLIAYASSFDQIGPVTRSVEDAGRILEVIAGYDERDTTSSKEPIPNFTATAPGSSFTVGYFQEDLEHPSLDPEIKSRCMAAMERLSEQGVVLKPLTFSLSDYLVPCYYILTTAEASSNLARYDGVRYGHRSQKGSDLGDMYRKSRSEGFGTEVKRRIMLGTFVLSSGYYEAYYTQAMKVRRLIRQQTLELLQTCDAILGPVTPGPAFKIGEKSQDPIEMYLSDVFTVHANLAGIPAISVPVEPAASGLPLGVQFMGQPFSEQKLLQLAEMI
ncbi:MAG: Asp-tRNA(Asn)/Glu-tRNA(Gln) amidotransferase subunit GatA [Bacteroidota bacterium]